MGFHQQLLFNYVPDENVLPRPQARKKLLKTKQQLKSKVGVARKKAAATKLAAKKKKESAKMALKAKRDAVGSENDSMPTIRTNLGGDWGIRRVVS